MPLAQPISCGVRCQGCGFPISDGSEGKLDSIHTIAMVALEALELVFGPGNQAPLLIVGSTSVPDSPPPPLSAPFTGQSKTTSPAGIILGYEYRPFEYKQW